MPGLYQKLKDGFLSGLRKGLKSYLWLLKIVIPVSFLVTVLEWSGWLSHLDFLLDPVMSLLNLPPEAALPIITGLAVNLYAAIAVMAAIPFTVGQMTLIAVFCLIAHNLITESIIQHKSGLNAAKAVIIRIAAAVIAVLIASQFITGTAQAIPAPDGMITTLNSKVDN